ncbi:hypothetical protein B0H11DRAFT_2385871 [Mycena galericulata]|nr:hypothetical protein B0H11DRAFT_2385871 [Mycena galericulata]
MDNLKPEDPSSDSNSDISSQSTGDEQPVSTNAMFAWSKVKISGGYFNNYGHYQNGPTSPSTLIGFREIPLGDLDLRNEIRLNSGSDTVNLREGRCSVKRVYSARVHGCKSNMTVAIYQGDGAEEDWRSDISKYSWIRHPNIIQVFATVAMQGLHATIYHGDFILAKDALEMHGQSHFATVYMWFCIETEYQNGDSYLSAVRGTILMTYERTIWMRLSTGQLCLELTTLPSDEPSIYVKQEETTPIQLGSPFEPHPDSDIISSMSPWEYHMICVNHLSQRRSVLFETYELVMPGAIYYWPVGARFSDTKEIAYANPSGRIGKRLRMAGGADDAAGNYFDWSIWSNTNDIWLAEADHIFEHLDVHIDNLTYILQISQPTDSIPPGYLFLCHPEDFYTNGVPAYWSLDPHGVECLSMDEAQHLGFPNMELKMEVEGQAWDANVYTGLRRFHQVSEEDDTTDEIDKIVDMEDQELDTASEARPNYFDSREDWQQNPSNEQNANPGSSDGPNVPRDDSCTELTMAIFSREDSHELDPPSSTWIIVMHVQLVLILTLAAFSLYEYLIHMDYGFRYQY